MFEWSFLHMEANSWKCETCGTINPPFAKFCTTCGAQRPGLWTCSQGHLNLPFANYCTICGEPRPRHRPEPAQKHEKPPVQNLIGKSVNIRLGKPWLKPLEKVLRIHGYECRSILGKTHLSATLLCVDQEGFPHVLKIPAIWFEYLMGILPQDEISKLRITYDRTGVLKKEAEALEAVRNLDHPCIVKFEGALESGAGDPPSLVFEFCEGGSLDDVLTRHGKLDPLLAAEIFVQIADALATIHDLGYVHGDIKPGNILFSRDRIPRLADFNSSRAIAVASRSEVPYTLGYASPEQLREKRPSKEGDVWSLALTIYETVTGKPLIPIEQYVETILSLDSDPEVKTGDKDLDKILSKCLKLNPKERPSMKELRDMLAGYLERKRRQPQQ
uniref:Protein kinase domain-containing protein n=1 Tax=Thermofilum adornatum TaxID=1365176 RepID=A0A7C1CCQ3_9CREN